MEEVKQREQSLTDEIVRDYRLEGEAHYNSYDFDKALHAYERALTYVSKGQTPQLWAATLIDIGRANWQVGIITQGLAIQQHLHAAVTAYHQALEVYTREQLPQDWATTQNNLGNALEAQGIRTEGKESVRLLAEAVAACRRTLEVYTRGALPLQWAQIHKILAQAYASLEDWPNAAASYADVLEVYPDDREAYQTASFLYHEKLFEFPKAFVLNEKWLEGHGGDLSALSNFAELHFATSRFVECERRLDALLANPAVDARVNIVLRSIEIANLLALHKTDLVPNHLDTLLGIIANQPEDFKVRWSFEGTKYFISHNETLAPYRSWLLQFFKAMEGEDRHAILTTLQEARTNVQAILRP